MKSQLPASMKSISGSWEEKAFAEDSSGHLGGCIWPPRSYSCSFCNREFRVSTLSNQENLSEHAFVSPPSSSFVQEQHKGYSYLHDNLSGSDHSLSARLHSKPEAERNQGEAKVTCLNHDKFVATDLFMDLGSVINSHGLLSPGSCGGEAISCKRPRTSVSVLSLLVKPRPNDRYILQSEAAGPTSSSKEGIDLELRLGTETPKR